MTIAQLEAELARLKGVSLKDFYFILDDDEFIVVPKKEWHLTHCTSDGKQDETVREALSKKWTRLTEGIFGYEGEIKDGTKELKKLGAIYLKDPFFEGFLTHLLKFGEEKYTWVKLYPDTQEIKDEVFQWMQGNEHHLCLQDYINVFKKEFKKYYIEVCDTKIFVMKKSTWRKIYSHGK